MIGSRKLFWKLFLGVAVLTAVVIGLSFWVIFERVSRSHAEEVTQRLVSEAATLQHVLADRFDRAHAGQLDRFLKELAAGKRDYLRISLILADGTVLADSEGDPATMESHGERKEVREALADGWGSDVRLSRTLSRRMRYVAVRVGEKDAPVGVVRVAVAERTLADQKQVTKRLLGTIAAIALAGGIVLALGLAWLWSKPIKRITAVARDLARGDLSSRVSVSGRDELAVLATALNRMRDKLAGQLETIDRHRRTLESLLAQLHEGVIVAGPDGRVVLINPAARRLVGLGESTDDAQRWLEGRAVEECIPHHELQQLLLHRDAAGASGGPIQECRLAMQGFNGETAVLARVSDIVLPAAEKTEESQSARLPPNVGRLLVLTDITAMNRAIQVKADFAANASHELRTPLSTIRAAVETLMRIDPAKDPKSAGHFLEVIDRQSSRMEAMVADLLDLSRLESSPAQFEPSTIVLREFFADLRARYEDKLNAKRLEFSVDLPAGLVTAVANPHLLRLILDNLLDNAIKFTDADGHISVTCERRTDSEGGTALSIEVSDDGCGIPEEEQGRVFERFYQVERARSGSSRGTGLGLSIVRHAVAAMAGRVELKSMPGAGTTVSITLPQHQDQISPAAAET